jgi:hypothetical protein
MQGFVPAKQVEFQASRGIKVDVLIEAASKTSIRALRYDHQAQTIRAARHRIQPGGEIALEVKTYSTGSFYPSAQLSDMVREISSIPLADKFLVVTQDFKQLGENKQAEIVFHITEAGGSVLVLDGFTAGATAKAATNFVNNLK